MLDFQRALCLRFWRTVPFCLFERCCRCCVHLPSWMSLTWTRSRGRYIGTAKQSSTLVISWSTLEMEMQSGSMMTELNYTVQKAYKYWRRSWRAQNVSEMIFLVLIILLCMTFWCTLFQENSPKARIAAKANEYSNKLSCGKYEPLGL